MSKINENTKMVDFPDVKLEKGETSTPVLENTAPQETHANTPTVKDVKEIVGGKGGSGSGDVVADNIFANDELEIGPSAGLGTNLREKVTPTRQVIATAGGLVVPTIAPTDETIVGIGTGREQIQIYLGDGLELVGNTSPYHIRVKNEPTEVLESLLQTGTRQVEPDEQEWIIKHYNDLSFSVKVGATSYATYPLIRSAHFDNIYELLFGYAEHTDDGAIEFLDQFHIYLNVTSMELKIERYEI